MELKEQLLALEEGFPESAKTFLASLARLRKQDDFIAQRQLARDFAKRWNVPFEDSAEFCNFAFLATAPFTKNPAIKRIWPVVRMGDFNVPMLKLIVDIRFERTLLLELVNSQIENAEAEWRSQGGKTYRDWDRETGKWEFVLKVRKAAKQGLTTSQIADRLRYRGDHSVIARARGRVGVNGYRKILPFLGYEEFSEHQVSSGPYPFNRHAKPPLTVEVVKAEKHPDEPVVKQRFDDKK